MLDDGPVTQAGHAAPACAHADTPHLIDNRQLHRKINQQELALTHLSEALVGLRRGIQALREENRELRRALEVAHGPSRAPSAGPGVHAHTESIHDSLRRSPS
jgi:hypothetical protein